MRSSPSISHWLPWLKDFLSSLVLIEEKAAELYHFSLLNKNFAYSWAKEPFFGIDGGSKISRRLHLHLLKHGFQKKNHNIFDDELPIPSYFREDLGFLHFIKPQIRPQQKPSGSGLYCLPGKNVSLVLENPNSVEVKYLDHSYEVRIPQVGRFILSRGLKLNVGRSLKESRVYSAVRNLTLILDLLATSMDLQNETIDDLQEVRPPILLREFLVNLKNNGPGSIVWESAQKLYLETHPGSKAVLLTSWYWKFLPLLSKTLFNNRT